MQVPFPVWEIASVLMPDGLPVSIPAKSWKQRLPAIV